MVEKIDQDTDFVSLESGHKPGTRIKNSHAAFSLFTRFKENTKQISYNRSRIQGLIDGNPPFNSDTLKKHAHSWEANINYREAEFIIESQASAIWEMFMEVPTLLTAECLITDEEQPSLDFGAIIAKNYDKVLKKRWKGFHFEVMFRIAELLKHGIGGCYWKDEFTWKPKTFRLGNLYFPPNTSPLEEDQQLFILVDDLPVWRVWEIIENGRISREEGWKPKFVKVTLTKTFTELSENDFYKLDTWGKIQQALKHQDSSTDIEFVNVRIAHCLFREPNGKITHAIFSPDFDLDDWLFINEDRFERFDQVLHFLFYGVSDGYAASVRGLGHKIFPFCDLSNRFINHTLNGAILAGGLLLQPNTETSGQNFRLTKVGSMTLLPANTTLMQTNVAPPIDKLIGARNMLQQILNKNTGVYKVGREDFGDNAPRSAREVSIEHANEARFQNNQGAWLYVQWNTWHQEIFRRLINPRYPKDADGYEDHEWFVMKCIADGVPAALMRNEFWDVEATQSIGLGSAAVKLDSTMQLLNAANAVSGGDERALYNIRTDWTAARFGWPMVKRYVKPPSREVASTSEHTIQIIENRIMMSGQPMPVGSDQFHAIHATITANAIQEIFNSIQQNNEDQLNGKPAMDYRQVVVPLQLLIRHLDGHIRYMARDPLRKNLVKPLLAFEKKAFGVLTKLSKMMDRQGQERNKQSARQQAVLAAAEQQLQNGDLKLEFQKVMNDLKIRMFKEESVDRQRQLKTMAAVALKSKATDAEIAREDRKAAATIRRKK